MYGPSGKSGVQRVSGYKAWFLKVFTEKTHYSKHFESNPLPILTLASHECIYIWRRATKPPGIIALYLCCCLRNLTKFRYFAEIIPYSVLLLNKVRWRVLRTPPSYLKKVPQVRYLPAIILCSVCLLVKTVR